MNNFLMGLLGLIAVSLAVVRSADHIHALWSGRRAGRPNLWRPALLTAATSVSSTLYAHCVGSDLYLLSAALINACNALMSVLVPTAVAGMPPPAPDGAQEPEESA